MLADDHSLILEGMIKQFELSSLYEIVGVADNGKKAWDIFESEYPDICILDIEMAHFDGIELAEMIKAKKPDTKVVLLTMHTSPWIIARARKANPNSILLKTMSCQEILNALTKIIEYENYFPTEIERLIKKNSQELITLSSVSSREHEVLKLIAEGLTTQQISEKLFLSVNTIETYRKNLLLKFEISNVAGLIRKATEMGII